MPDNAGSIGAGDVLAKVFDLGFFFFQYSLHQISNRDDTQEFAVFDHR